MPKGVYIRKRNPIVNLGSKPIRTIEERFWAKVDKTDGCWLWAGGRDGRGYGKIQIGTMAKPKYKNVARLSYELAFGPIPAGLHICHHCDIRHCVKPDHLFAGTAASNMADKVAKRRQPRGEEIPSAKLTRREVELIRALYLEGTAQSTIARAFQVDVSTVSAIVHNRTWRS